MLRAREWDGDGLVIVPNAMETSWARKLGVDVAIAIEAGRSAPLEPTIGNPPLWRRSALGSPAADLAPKRALAAVGKVHTPSERCDASI
jgi:hypothetical protein